MRYMLCAALLVALPMLAHADGMSEAEKEVIAQICDQARPKKNADIGAEYVAGVDVDGRKVAKADVDGGMDIFPVIIPVEVDLARKFGMVFDDGINFSPRVAQFEVFADGRILFNGKDVTPRAKEQCKALAKGEKPHGQEPAHGIGSGDIISGEYPENRPQYND